MTGARLRPLFPSCRGSPGGWPRVPGKTGWQTGEAAQLLVTSQVLPRQGADPMLVGQ